MKRIRSLDQWRAERTFEYASVSDFLKTSVSSGIHTLILEHQFLDVLIQDRGSTTTLVVFNSAVPPKVVSTPLLQGHGLAAERNINLVAVSDPSIELPHVDIGWHLGNKAIGALEPVLRPVLKHIIGSLNSSRNIFFGASGGGFAAVTYGDVIADSIVMVWNPRLDLGAKPLKAFSNYAFHAYGAGKTATQKRLRRRLMTEYGVLNKYKEGLPFDLLIFQNTGDHIFVEHQVMPVLQSMKTDPRMHARFEFTANGHRGAPRHLHAEMLDPLADSDISVAEAITKAGFKQAEKIVDVRSDIR